MRAGPPLSWLAPAVLGCSGLAALMCWAPPAGDDAYAHAVYGLEQVVCWRAGDPVPRFHPDWNGGTGSFLPTVYAPLVLSVNGVACSVVGEGTRALGVSLALALLAGSVVLWLAARGAEARSAWLWVLAPYPLTAALARATATELWALAAAGGVILLAAPPGPGSRRRCLALTVLVAVTSGCQVAMIVILGWVLAAAWVAAGLGAHWRQCARTAVVFATGLLLGGVLWWPTVADFAHMAREELVAGAYRWRENFLVPVQGHHDLGVLLVAVAASLIGVAVVFRSASAGALTPRTRALLAAMAWCGLMALPVSWPLWRLPGMAGLQFPWRFLGPASVVAVALVGQIPSRRARGAAMALLLIPVAVIPVKLDGGTPGLEAGLDGRELALRCATRYGLAPVLPSMPGLYSRGFHPVESLRRLGGQARSVELSGDRPLERAVEVGPGPSGPVLLPLQAWPEWRIEEAGAPVAHRNRAGLVEVELGAGPRTLHLSAAPSRSRRFGLVLGGLGLLLVGVWGRAWREGTQPAAEVADG